MVAVAAQGCLATGASAAPGGAERSGPPLRFEARNPSGAR